MEEKFSAVFTADVKDFDKKVKQLEKSTEAVAEEVTTPVNADISDAVRELDKMRGEIASLSSERAKIQADVSQVKQSLDELRREQVEINLQVDKARQMVNQLQTEIEQKKIEVNLQVEEARRNLAELRNELASLKDEQVKLTATVNKQQFDQAMAEMKAKENEFKRSATKNLYVNTQHARSEYARVEQQMKSLEFEAQRMGKTLDQMMTPSQLEGFRSYQRALIDSRNAMLPFKFQQMAIQGEFYKLATAGKAYAGSHRQWMGEISALGARDKAIKDEMINSNNMLRMSYVRQAGTFMNMTTQASRISTHYKNMGNAMYAVNRPALAVADSLNRIANNGQASVLALKMLGPTAGTKDLQNMVMMINQGLMRFAMVAAAAALASYKLYTSLHKDAMETNKVYEKAFNGMKKSLYDAFAPMRQIFQDVMIQVYNFINRIGQLIQKFNEAHPTLAKFIQGVMLIIPALTMILAPLAIGIGLFNGFRAAMFAVWGIIGPLVTGLASMSGTVLLIAALIVGLVMAFKHLWETNEGFRNAVVTAWETIKAKAMEVWNAVKTFLITTWETIKAKAMEVWNAIKEFWTQNGDEILANLTAIWNTIKEFLTQVWEGIKTVASDVWNAISTIVKDVWSGVSEFLTSLWNGIKTVAMTVWNGIKEYWAQNGEAIKQNVTEIWTAIKEFLTQAWEGIKTAAMTVWNEVKNVIMQAWGGVKEFVMQIWEQIMAFWTQYGTQISTATSNAWTLITTIITTALDILKSLFEAFQTYVLPLFQVLWEGVKTAFQVAWEAIKMIVQIALGIIHGIILMFTGIFTGDFDTFWEGVKMIFSTALEAIKTFITNTFNIIKEFITSTWNGIKEFFRGLWDGIKANIEQVWTAIKTFFQTTWEAIKTLFQTTLENIKTAVINAWNNMKSTITNAMNNIKTTIQNAWNNIKTTVQNALNNIKSTAQNAWNSIKSTITNAMNSIKSSIQNAWNSIKSTVTNAMNSIKSTVTNAWNSLKSSISSSISEIKSTVQNGWESIKSFLSGIDLGYIGRQIMQSLIDGVQSMIGALQGVFNSITSMIPDWKGPYRVDKVLLTPAGEAIMGSLIKGLDSETRHLKNFLYGTTRTIETSLNTMTLSDLASDFNDLNMSKTQSLHSTINEEVTLQKQPANITIKLGKNDFKTFVDDINEVNSEYSELERVYAL